ncbi:DUF922 domain-containing protein [Ottowia sp.]|uniref:DUF922 domain-containing protein n=1 Tax=Ottowia sp. TaxID=1898956 RepID=UPI0039E5A4A0
MDHARRPVPLVVCLACFAANASAQIYRCEHAGRVDFSDRPCAGGNATRQMTANSGPRIDIQFKTETDAYSVPGADLAAAYAFIRARGPGGYWAMARWNPSYTYQYARNGDTCRITAAEIKLVGHILMPEWRGKSGASATDQAKWNLMHAKLLRHEQGHIQYGREFSILLRERLAGMGFVPCTELAGRARSIYDKLLTNLRERDRDYDRRTEHGVRQDNPIN